MSPLAANPIILYDGVCGLCNRLNQFVLKRDQEDRFRFAFLQSEFARGVLSRHGIHLDGLDTVYVVLDYQQQGERLLARSDAVISVLRGLGGVWGMAAVFFRILPQWLRNRLYELVAGNRYRLFGRYESCLMPAEEHRGKFIDL